MNDIAKPISAAEAQKKFEENVKARLKEDLSDMMPDEVLQAIVQETIKDAIYKPRKIAVPRAFGGPDVKEYEPLLVELVRDLLKDQVQSYVLVWFKEHPDEVKELAHKVCAEGILGAVQFALKYRLTDFTDQFVKESIERLQNDPYR